MHSILFHRTMDALNTGADVRWELSLHDVEDYVVKLGEVTEAEAETLLQKVKRFWETPPPVKPKPAEQAREQRRRLRLTSAGFTWEPSDADAPFEVASQLNGRITPAQRVEKQLKQCLDILQHCMGILNDAMLEETDAGSR